MVICLASRATWHVIGEARRLANRRFPVEPSNDVSSCFFLCRLEALAAVNEKGVKAESSLEAFKQSLLHLYRGEQQPEDCSGDIGRPALKVMYVPSDACWRLHT